jgi:hypothetical protein
MLHSPGLPTVLTHFTLHRNRDSAIQIKLGFFVREYGVIKIGYLFRLLHGLFLD